MGSQGSSAPAPDPRLIEAQIKSMGIQDDAIGQVLKNSNDLAPIQKAQMQFGLDSAKTAYTQSQDDRVFALGKRAQLSGIQDTLVNDAKTFNEAGRADELAGRAGADVSSAFANAEAQQARALERTGVAPGSGKSMALGNQTAMAKAAALAGAKTNARSGARAEGMGLKDRAANALAGYPAMGMQTTGSGAGFGSSGIGLANSSLAGLNSGASSAGGLASQLGGNASSMYGTMGSYKNGADAQANSTTNAVFGGLGSVIGGGLANPTIGSAIAKRIGL